MDCLILLLARGGGLGLAPKAPGTVGTLGGFPLTALLLVPGNFWIYLAGCAALVPLSAWICGEAERILDCEDPGEVVFDEIIAVPMCFLGVFALMTFQGEGMPSVQSVCWQCHGRGSGHWRDLDYFAYSIYGTRGALIARSLFAKVGV